VNLTYEVVAYDYEGRIVEEKKFNTYLESKLYFENQFEKSKPELSFDLFKIEKHSNHNSREILHST